MDKPLYNDLGTFLKKKFKKKMYKVSIDAGFSCPNLDGKLSEEGCMFCNNESIAPRATGNSVDIAKQLNDGMDYIGKRHKAEGFIAYLQKNSNTYGETERLREIYFSLADNERVEAIAISTRPDCIDEGILKLICDLRKKKYVWLEMGLQSSSDETLKRINRNHDLNCFLRSFDSANSLGIPVCVHVIFGLPGEGRQEALNTIKLLSELGVFGVKIHSLHVVKNTQLYDQFKKGNMDLMSKQEYVSLVADALEIMSPDIVIHRLTGEGPREITVAPQWSFNKMDVMNCIKDELKKRGSCQGFKYFNSKAR